MADSRLIEAIMMRPPVRGREDCCTAVADILMADGHADYAADWRGRYDTLAKAHALMGGNLESFMPRFATDHGWAEIRPADAESGDVGVVGDFLFIRHQGAWVGKSLEGMRLMRRVRRAWRPQRGN